MKKTILLVKFVFTIIGLSAQTISGVVLDTQENALVDASVIVGQTNVGAACNEKGEFVIEYEGAFPCVLHVSYLGYSSRSIELNDATRDLVIYMEEDGVIGQEIIVSASRRSEKVLEAPAAVSVLNSNEVSKSGGSISPIRALINTPGVERKRSTTTNRTTYKHWPAI